MNKKQAIIMATCEVINKDGVDQFTLEAVAHQANISKGGLLYHFSSKDELIEAMNTYAATDFRKILTSYVEEGKSFHEAYILATKQTIEQTELMQITTSLLAALSINRDLLHIWKKEYHFIQEHLQAESVEPVVTSLVKSVCDGIWFGALFPFEFMDRQEQETVLNYLLKQLQKD